MTGGHTLGGAHGHIKYVDYSYSHIKETLY